MKNKKHNFKQKPLVFLLDWEKPKSKIWSSHPITIFPAEGRNPTLVLISESRFINPGVSVTNGIDAIANELFCRRLVVDAGVVWVKFAGKFSSEVFVNPPKKAELIIKPHQITLGFAKELEMLEPFGRCNPEPLFESTFLVQANPRILKEKHLKLVIIYNYDPNFLQI